MKANYHTHTSRCRHAVGEDEAYVQAALAAGFDVLGFADHAPFPFASGYESGIRMTCDQLPDYFASVRKLQQQYADRIRIHLGLEAEYFPRYHDHLLRMREAGICYYVLGQHYADSEEYTPYTGKECVTDDGVRRYADATVRAMRTGLFAYVAHPDLMMRHRTDDEFSPACMEAADQICACALELHMPLEYNLLGLRYELEGHSRGYPSVPFWQYIRKYNNTVILGVDAHDPRHIADDSVWDIGMQRVQDMGFTLTDHLPVDADLP